METMRPAEIEAVIKFARVGLATFTERALLWVSSVGGIAAFGYAVVEPEYPRILASIAYALFIVWPILRHEKKKEQ